MHFKSFLKDYFSHSKRESNGILILFIILILLIIAPQLLYLFRNREVTDFSEFEKEVNQFLTAQANSNKPISSFSLNKKNNPYFSAQSFTVSDSVKKRSLHYSGSNNFNNKNGYRKNKPLHPLTQSIDINLTDSSTLVKLNGIGPKLSSRIIKYRNALGGFQKKEQLLEVYGIDSALFQIIQSLITVDAKHIAKININNADSAVLAGHPYIRYKIANAIVRYRKQHGNFSMLDDLKKSYLINDEIYNKIASYLTI